MKLPVLKRNSDGRAYCWHQGKRKWFKKFGTPESDRMFNAFRAGILTGSPPPPVRPGRLTVAELVERYLHFAEGYYKGSPKTILNVHDATRLLLTHFARKFVDEFTPLRLKKLQQFGIDADLARKTINYRVDIVRRIFKWGVSEELVAETTWQSLMAVEHLAAGRSAARESPGVRPVAWADIAAVLPHLSPTVRDMVLVQYLCGMRPQDVCGMTAAEIDQHAAGWLYKPAAHKNAHRGVVLIKAIPRAAQAILERRIASAAPGAFLFQPRDSAAEYAATRTRPERTTKRYPSEARRLAAERAAFKKKFRPLFTTGTYRQAIHHGIKRGPGLTLWNPNQLRHAISTELARELGQQASQRWLGHSSLDTTAIYTEIQVSELRQIATAVDRLLAPRTAPFASTPPVCSHEDSRNP